MKKGTKKYLRAIKGDCTHLKVETYYNIGGMNYFSGNAEKRGLYISVSPVSRSEHEGGLWSESYKGFSGTKQLVKEMARFNQKVLDNFKDEVTEKRLIEHVCRTQGIELEEKV